MLARGFALAAMLAGAANAEDPLSAIDWLSESLLQPPNFVIAPPNQPGQAPPTPISSMPLAVVSRDAVGILPPETTGFPSALWGGLGTTEIIALLRQARRHELPESAALEKQVLLAQSNPPLDSRPNGPLFIARIDRLFAMGALDEAETLVLLAGVAEPELFRRWFEIALIGQRTAAPCAALAANPSLSNDVATRVICLARSGDWNAAALTVSLAESLGQISTEDTDLMVRFLDPEMFADLPEPEIPDPLDPITFTLRESLALPRPETPLPLPYLNADMYLRTPARQRIIAAERLVRESAVPPSLLFFAYRGVRAASSGGAWGRAELVQALDAELLSGNDAALATAITDAMIAFADAGLLHAFANEYADSLSHYPPGPETSQIAPRVRRLLLLAGRPLAFWAGLGAEDPSNVALAIKLASHGEFGGVSPYRDPVLDAIHQAFSNFTPERAELPTLMEKISAGDFGEVLFRALDLLAKGQSADPQDLHAGLYLLRQLGLEDNARRAAIQLLLIEPEPA